jgi:hypothetical protein
MAMKYEGLLRLRDDLLIPDIFFRVDALYFDLIGRNRGCEWTNLMVLRCLRIFASPAMSGIFC